MARGERYIDISETPELLRLVAEVEQTGQPSHLRRGGVTVAVLAPVVPGGAKVQRPRIRRRSTPIPPDDPLFDIVGMSSEPGPTDVSANKHRYLSEAYYPSKQPAPEG
jgi:hypothetical protein